MSQALRISTTATNNGRAILVVGLLAGSWAKAKISPDSKLFGQTVTSKDRSGTEVQRPIQANDILKLALEKAPEYSQVMGAYLVTDTPENRAALAAVDGHLVPITPGAAKDTVSAPDAIAQAKATEREALRALLAI